MSDQKKSTYHLFWMLGLAITLPMILISGPITGYLVGWVLIHNFGMPSLVTPLCMSIGLLGSGLQAFRLIQKLKDQTDSKKTS